MNQKNTSITTNEQIRKELVFLSTQLLTGKITQRVHDNKLKELTGRIENTHASMQ